LENEQDKLLKEAKEEDRRVKIYLVNGMQLVGKISSFSRFVVVLDIKGEQNMIYKHAISTIVF